MDKDGNTFTNGLDYYQHADKLLHQYHGDLNQQWLQRYTKDYMNIMQRFPRRNLDTAFMKGAYGSDYEDFIENAATGKYSVEVLQDEFKKRNLTWMFSDEHKENRKFFNLFYDNDHIRSFYQASMLPNDAEIHLKTSEPGTQYIDDTKEDQTYMTNQFNEMKNTSYSIENVNAYTAEQLNIIQQLAKRHPNQTFDSVIGNTLFLKAMDYINILTLLVITIMLSNIFAMESSTKSNQIIMTSVHGNQKTALAKIITSILLSAGLIILQLIIILIMSYIFVPMRDLNMLIIPQAKVEISQVTSFLFTYKEVIVAMIVVNMIAAIATGMLTTLLSYLTKNRFITATVILSLLLGITLCMLIYPSQIWNGVTYFHLPTMMQTATFYKLFDMFDSFPYTTIFNNNVSYRFISITAWIGITIIFSMLIYTHSKKHTIHQR